MRAGVALALFVLVALAQAAQSQTQPPLQTQPPAQLQAQSQPQKPAQPPKHAHPRPPIAHHTAALATQPASEPAAAAAPPPAPAATVARPGGLLAEVTLADIGFVNGVRFANLGGHNDLYVPLPQDADVAAIELVLALDDVSAYEARRHLEVQINDRTVSSIALDGKSRDRIIRIPLGKARPKDGYLKLSFLYAGAVSPDRCIDVRYVGDSVIVRPESAVEVDVGPVAELDVATTAKLMPREVTVVLPGRRVTASEIASAITVARSLIASGRHVTFQHGFDGVKELGKRDESGHWMHGVILVGPLDEVAGVVDSPLAKMAGAVQSLGTLAAVRVGGSPALIVSDGDAVRAGQLFASPLLRAARGVTAASVGEAKQIDLPSERITFEQLAIGPVVRPRRSRFRPRHAPASARNASSAAVARCDGGARRRRRQGRRQRVCQ